MDGDLVSRARITLPLRAGSANLPFQYDPARNTWMVTSRNTNLRIVGQFSCPGGMDDGTVLTGCGFVVAQRASFAQVAGFRDRLLLLHGYHRAFGLLARGRWGRSLKTTAWTGWTRRRRPILAETAPWRWAPQGRQGRTWAWRRTPGGNRPRSPRGRGTAKLVPGPRDRVS